MTIIVHKKTLIREKLEQNDIESFNNLVSDIKSKKVKPKKAARHFYYYKWNDKTVWLKGNPKNYLIIDIADTNSKKEDYMPFRPKGMIDYHDYLRIKRTIKLVIFLVVALIVLKNF